MITGTLKSTPKTKTFALNIATMMFDIEGLVVEPNGYKAQDNHPDYIISARTPRGNLLRVGAMWKAVSEKTEREYYSLSVKDRRGKTWRMNAVRNDEMAKGEWSIVPLAGGESEPIAIGGEVEQLDDGNMVALIESYDFSMNVVLVAVAEKREDNHPDFQIEGTSPEGKTVRMGSAWKQVSQKGNDYLSLSLYAPGGAQHRANAVTGADTTPGKYDIIPLSAQVLEAVA